MSFDLVFKLAMKYLPTLISIAEGIFSWKQQSGEDKKSWVMDTLQRIVDAITRESKGGQASTWEKMHDSVSNMIDAMVEFANAAGFFDNKPTGGDIPVSPRTTE